MKLNKCKKISNTVSSDARAFCLSIILAAATALSLSSAYGQDQKPGEYQVKATFLYNFAKFVEWPGKKFIRNGDVINLCLLGEDPFGPAFDTIQDETVGNKRLVIKHLNRHQHLESCHLLFISGSEEADLAQIVKSIRGLSILSVADTKGFAQQGVIINFYIDRNKVRFEINVDAANRSGLRISSKLMKLGRIIQD